MTAHTRHYIVVNSAGGSAGIVMEMEPRDAARAYGLQHHLGGQTVHVTPLAAVGMEREAKWTKYELIGPECTPEAR